MEDKKPEIKFTEHTNLWEVYALSEVANIHDGTHQTPNYTTSGIPFVSVENIHNIDNSKKFISEKDYEEQFKVRPEEGDLFMTRITAGIIGATAVLENNKPLAYYVSLALIKPFTETNGLFLSYSMSTSWFKKELNKRIIHTAFPKKINLSDIGKCRIFKPNTISEQIKIGGLLKKIDRTISIQQQELKTLKQTKQGFLQKMFPKEGETVPEVRFEGFTDEWKETNFQSIAKVRRGLTYKPVDVEATGVRVLRSSNINGESFLLKDDDIFVNPKAVNIEYAKDGEILITSANGSSKLVGKHALIKNVGTETVHGGFMLIASATSPYFVNSLMSSSWYDKFINVHVSGGNGSIGNLNKNDLESYKVLVPSLEERNKIGEFFKQLDKTIELHEKELEALKETKKAFLQKMFV